MKSLGDVAFEAFKTALRVEGSRSSPVPLVRRVWARVADAVAVATRERDALLAGERSRLQTRSDLLEQEVRRRMGELTP